MSDTEKQEGQKTVVAFIAGLLIGGLLVWVFSSSPADAPVDSLGIDEKPDTTESTTKVESTKTDTTVDSANTIAVKTVQVDANASVSVSNQAAGAIVTLGDTTFPTNDGWIAVREVEDGVLGRILGAARYSIDLGLVPGSVQLLRATEAGKTYAVTFFTENGDRVFDLNDDIIIEGVDTTFTAQ
jgi:hypothetical protein